LRVRLLNRQNYHLNNVCFNITIGEVEVDDVLGPDSYGYYAYENIDDTELYPETPEYDWIELDPEFEGEGAEHHQLNDDSTFAMELPFAFNFYGDEYDTISICSNGWISFENTWMTNFRNWGIPSPLGPHTMVCPFWDDLVGERGEDDMRENLNIFTRFDQNQGRFIIEWSRVVARTSAEDHTQSFEVILYDPAVHETPTGDGIIIFQYHNVEVIDRNERNFATVGIQDWNHQQGLEISYASLYPDAIDSLRPGRAIKLTTTPPDTFLTVKETEQVLPTEFIFDEPYPNPFNSSVRISYLLPEETHMNLSIYNTYGQLVEVLQEGTISAGRHNVLWAADGTPTGVYLVRMTFEGGIRLAIRKVVLVK